MTFATLALLELSTPADISKNLPDVIKAASSSPLGILALMIVALAGLAFYFFKSSSEKVKIGIFVMLFCGVALYGYELRSASQNKHNVYGTVIDSNNNSIPGAVVTILETGDKATTDGLGQFSFWSQQPSIHLRVDKNGYDSATWQVTLPQTGDISIPINPKSS